jgi:diguanylate cyclase (GGDEF)-like protein
VYFSRELENALRHLRPGSGFAVHWIDLDKFKEVNDRIGHPVGGALLKRSSRCARPCGDTISWRGSAANEFAVVQAGATTPREAEKLTTRLLTAIRTPRNVLGHEITIGASIGVVLAPRNGTSADELMKNVDVALYAAKAAGRGTFAHFEHEKAA